MVQALQPLQLPIIVVDEHSEDGTGNIAASLGVMVYQREGSGKGWGIRKALQVAHAQGYDVLVLIDCDCTYDPRDIPQLLSVLGNAGCAIGCRPMQAISWSHRLVNYLHTGTINLLFGARLHDINSGLRAIRVHNYVEGLTADGFDIEAQMTTHALQRGLGVVEVPVAYRKRLGRSKIRAWDTLRILRRIIAARFVRRPVTPPAGEPNGAGASVPEAMVR